MQPIWLSVACCVSVLVVHGYAAAVPTQDTFVVAKAEGENTEKSEKNTAEEPNVPIKLTKMQVNSEVSLRYAHTTVVTHVRNPSSRSQEATFHILLPETAFISGFVMTLDGKSYKAYVKEKEEAKNLYSDAVSKGTAAAHISAKARDSNHFTVSVNVEPNTEAEFNLTYEELLVRRNGVYNHAINLHPGALVPKMEVTVHIKESQKISLLRVPEIRTGNEIDATENDAHNAKAVINKSNDDKEATITFSPDLDEQKRLMEIYSDKIKESTTSTHNSDVEQSDNEKTTGVLGQFVVQYDVIRPEKGEILVNDGYFVHFFAPEELKPLSKLVVFVLDTSSSMYGRKIEQLQTAMKAILADLRSSDYFSIVEFNSDVQVHKLSETHEEVTAPNNDKSGSDFEIGLPGYIARSESASTITLPVVASPTNIAKAQDIVSRFSARGGTNIYEALNIAIDVIKKAYETNKTESSAAFDNTEAERIKALQPIIIFLTDGDATVGETNPKRILSSITEKNTGERKAAVYSLAFGHDADRDLLRKLSLRNEGFMRQIYEASDAALQLRHFYRQISSPLLADVDFIYPPNQVKAESLTRNEFDTLFAGAETVVAGKLEPNVRELASHVIGLCADDDNHYGRKSYKVKNEVKVSETKEYLPLERLWAYLSIKQLLDDVDAFDHDDKDEKRSEKYALSLALKYEFVTPLTSLVVVKPNATIPVDTVSADKPDTEKPSNTFYAIPLSPSPVHSSIGFGQTIPYAEVSLIGGAGNIAPEDSFLDTDSTTSESLEETCHLENYSWALNILNKKTNSLEFLANGKNVTLELSKSDTIPKASEGDSECAHSAGVGTPGEAGVCVYLTRCAAARDISVDEFRNKYCVVENKYAGVCCPKNKVDTEKPLL
ncbi:inter-alpha-trypsin inhibitor heavy chain H4-like isoform X2 [Nymphalis io]|uniref:inter-alpha-trypsin inhibitor heavy chain H4-like isoform X2 n=1 Tax=Inachis io TaxID=171585 RepID=UPI0021687354|nr:inter-alpha-trypsin inhibitor heavy chain H4-like isoform X2 [Nymphalis io]